MHGGDTGVNVYVNIIPIVVTAVMEKKIEFP